MILCGVQELIYNVSFSTFQIDIQRYNNQIVSKDFSGGVPQESFCSQAWALIYIFPFGQLIVLINISYQMSADNV